MVAMGAKYETSRVKEAALLSLEMFLLLESEEQKGPLRCCL